MFSKHTAVQETPCDPWLRVGRDNFAAAPVEPIFARTRDAVMCTVYPVPDPYAGDQVIAAVEAVSPRPPN
jgi:hypothetical protein